VYLRAINYGGDNSPSSNVVIRGVTINVVGRNCVSLISISGLTISGISCANASLHGIDGEPNRSSDVISGISIADSVFSTWDAGHTPQGIGYAIVIGPGYANVQSKNVKILRNALRNTTGMALIKINGYSTTARASAIVVTGNRPSVAGTAYFSHVSGLTFSDNSVMTSETDDVVP
jgi:hypothetical protein